MIKIETREAWQHLPELMLAGMRHENVAMLLARGDLAVECGMLNKGPKTMDALRMLGDMLKRSNEDK